MSDNIIDILHHQLKSGLEESMMEIRREILQEIAEDPEYDGQADILVAALDNLLEELKHIKSLNPDGVPVRQRAKVLAYLGLVNELLEEFDGSDDLEDDEDLMFLFDDEEEFEDEDDFEEDEVEEVVEIKPKKKAAAPKAKAPKPKAANKKAPAPTKKKK